MRAANPGAARMIALVGVHLGVDYLHVGFLPEGVPSRGIA
jgi:hypothetical protein